MAQWHRVTSISKDEEEPHTGSVCPFPAREPGDDSSEVFKEVHSGRKFCCSKCPRKYNTKSNMVKLKTNVPLRPARRPMRSTHPGPVSDLTGTSLETTWAEQGASATAARRTPPPASGRRRMIYTPIRTPPTHHPQTPRQ